TPIQYVGHSVEFLREGVAGLLALIDSYRAFLAESGAAAPGPGASAAVLQAEDDCDLDYLRERMPAAFERTLDGVRQVGSIVGALKEFAPPSGLETAPADVNRALENTLIVARNEYKYVAEVATELGLLPPVVCNIGDLSQVFLNLIVNAAHAIA